MRLLPDRFRLPLRRCCSNIHKEANSIVPTDKEEWCGDLEEKHCSPTKTLIGRTEGHDDEPHKPDMHSDTGIDKEADTDMPTHKLNSFRMVQKSQQMGIFVLPSVSFPCISSSSAVSDSWNSCCRPHEALPKAHVPVEGAFAKLHSRRHPKRPNQVETCTISSCLCAQTAHRRASFSFMYTLNLAHVYHVYVCFGAGQGR